MATTNDFLKLLYDQVGRGIYVWGGDGELLDTMENPIAWIERHETSTANAKRAIALYRERVRTGVSDIRAFDCSGLVYWALHSLGLQKSDVSSRGLYSLCEKIEKSELRPGDLVFHHNGVRIVHVGVWANDGNQIECRGRDYGVVCNKRRSGYWNRFGRWKKLGNTLLGDANCDGQVTAADAALILRYLNGLSDLTEQGKLNADYNQDGKITKEDAELIMQHIVGLKSVRVIGKSVNVRNSDSTKGKVLGVAHKGDTFAYRATAPTGWYEIDYKGKVGYIRNRSDLTELR